MVIEAKQIVKIYDKNQVDTKALRGVSFNANKNEFISIMGPSGCGKSTLLYILSGLESFNEGSLKVLDLDMKTAKVSEKTNFRANNIGFVFQNFQLITELNVFENVMLPTLIAKTNKSKDDIYKLLELVELKGYEKRFPSQLSGGQQQRVAIARALVNDPLIIFADEPTGNLDNQTGLNIMELFKKVNETLSTTIIMVTHNADLIKYTTRTLYMLDGRITKDEINY